MDALELVAKLKMDISEYEKGLDKASKDANGFGSKLKSGLGTAAKVGAAAMAAVTTASVALGKTLVSNANEVADYGDHVDKMSQKMGITSKAYQEWDAVLQHCGTSIDAMKPSFKQLSVQAQKGNEAFKQLGITEEELRSLSQEDLFGRVVEGLQNMEEGTERTAIASQLLGRGATELGALLNTSAEETQKMKDRVNELGGVMSNDAVKAAAKFKDNLQDMKTAMSAVKRNLVSEFLPAFSDLMDGFTKLIAGEEGAEEALNSGMEKMTASIDKVVPRIMSLLETLLPQVITLGGQLVIGIAKSLPNVISAVAKQLPTLFKELLKAAKQIIPDLIKVGADLIQSIADGMGDGESVLDIIVELMESVLNAIVDNFPKILDSGMTILDKLIDGIIKNLPKIGEAVFKIIEKLGTTIITKLPEILQRGKDILLKLVRGIIDNLPTLIQGAVQLVTTLVTTLTQHLPEILQMGFDLLLELVNGILEAIPELIAMLPEIINAIVDNLLNGDTIGKLLDAGLGIIEKIFEGIMNGDFLELLGKIGSALLNAIGAAFGAVFSIGEKIIGKIWEGMKSAWNAVSDWLSGVIYGTISGTVGQYSSELDAFTGGAAGAQQKKKSGYTKDDAITTGNTMADRYRQYNVYVGDKKAATITQDGNKKSNKQRG